MTPSSFALSWNGTACDWSLPMLCQIELPVAGFRSNQETSDTSLMDCELPLMSVECTHVLLDVVSILTIVQAMSSNNVANP